MRDDDPNACEMAYKNGKEAMRAAILDKLTDAKGKAIGVQRFYLDELIQMVKKLEVRP